VKLYHSLVILSIFYLHYMFCSFFVFVIL